MTITTIDYSNYSDLCYAYKNKLPGKYPPTGRGHQT